jgi:DNA-binding transcriptional LysR family regulator
VRIAHLPDSSLRAVHVGNVRRVACASPAYLAEHGVPRTPRDLARHALIVVAAGRPAGMRWSFGGPDGALSVPVKSRLTVNTVQAALEAAVQGGGIARVLSYQAATREVAGEVQTLLRRYEPKPIPIHVVHPAGRYLPAKTRLFIDRAVATLREKFSEGRK